MSPVQMLVHHHRATRQTRSPSHRFDLQAEILEADRVVPVHRTLELQGEDDNFGTWQGRLPQELRLLGIQTLEAANLRKPDVLTC